MSVHIAKGVLSRIRERRDGFVLQVRSVDPGAAAEALRLARDDLYDLDLGREEAFGLSREDRAGPSMVSNVIPAPTGPMLYIDASDVPLRLVRRIPEVVADRLELSGITEAVIASPSPGGPMDATFELATSISLHLWPQPAYQPRETPQVPWEWIEGATTWLSSLVGTTVWVNVAGVQFETRIDEARELLRGLHAGRESSSIVGGRLDARVASIRSGWSAVVVGVAGAAWHDEELPEIFSSLTALGRSYARSVGTAFVVIDESPSPLILGTPPETRPPGAAHWSAVQWANDVLVVDAFCWQVLGPSHVERLGGVPPQAEPLEGERWEISIGTFADWLPATPTRAMVQAEGRRMLAPCLVDAATARAVADERRRRRW